MKENEQISLASVCAVATRRGELVDLNKMYEEIIEKRRDE